MVAPLVEISTPLTKMLPKAVIEPRAVKLLPLLPVPSSGLSESSPLPQAETTSSDVKASARQL
jgi:hypothetical protein